MIENARRGGQCVGVEMELGKEKYNECSEERGRRRDGETETASKSKTSLMPIYVEGRKRDRMSRGLRERQHSLFLATRADD